MFFLFNKDLIYSNYPKGIRLILIDPQDNEMLITWYTDYEAYNPEIKYSMNKDLSDSIVLKPDSVLKINKTFLYTVQLKDLKPSTRYYYQVSSDIFYKRDIMSFKTFPKNIQNLSFLVISDSQADSADREIRKNLFNQIQNEKFDFYIHCGDIVENSKSQENWNNFFEDFEEISSKKIGLYTQGNHDSNPNSELFYVNIPIYLKEFDSYSIKFRNFSYFISLDTENYIDPQWLRDYLESNLNYNWKFSFFHRPIHNSMIGRDDINIVWDSIFSEFNFSLVFSGHNHIYERLLINKLNYIICPSIAGDIKSLERFKFSNSTINYEFSRGYIIANINLNSLTLKILGFNRNLNEVFQLDNLTIYR